MQHQQQQQLQAAPASPKPGSWAARVASSPAKKDVTTATIDKTKDAVPQAGGGGGAVAESSEKGILPPVVPSAAAAVAVGAAEKKAQAPSGDNKKVYNGASSKGAGSSGAKIKKEFTGVCYKCGEKGHRASDCKNEEVVKAA